MPRLKSLSCIGTSAVIKTERADLMWQKHAWTYDHVIDFTNSKVIDSGSDGNCKNLECCNTAVTNNADTKAPVTLHPITMQKISLPINFLLEVTLQR